MHDSDSARERGVVVDSIIACQLKQTADSTWPLELCLCLMSREGDVEIVSETAVIPDATEDDSIWGQLLTVILYLIKM